MNFFMAKKTMLQIICLRNTDSNTVWSACIMFTDNFHHFSDVQVTSVTISGKNYLFISNLGKINNWPIFLARNRYKKIDFNFLYECSELLQFISEGPITELRFQIKFYLPNRSINFPKYRLSADHVR